jgi:hypothetical protein
MHFHNIRRSEQPPPIGLTTLHPLGPLTGSDKGIDLCALATIFLEARIKTFKRCRTPVERHVKRSALSAHFKNVCGSQPHVERTIGKCIAKHPLILPKAFTSTD